MQTSRASFISRPQLYGGFGSFNPDSKTGAVFQMEQRQRLNLIPIFQCLFLPWLLFCGVYGISSSAVHYYRPGVCYALVAVGAIFVAASGLIAFNAMLGRHGGVHQQSWYIFLFITLFVSWTLGVVFGNLNFWAHSQPYFNYLNMDVYKHVDPTKMRGQQVMDAGRLQFLNGSMVDVRRSIGFKNLDTYCVAPISLKKNGAIEPLEVYDFWAVGLDCCSIDKADFHCGDYQNPNASSGLRLLEDDQRDFFRLAVQQAEAAYGIKATHPLFVYWVPDATAEMASFRDDGYKYFLIGVLAQFAWQSLCVTLAAIGFSKIGHD